MHRVRNRFVLSLEALVLCANMVCSNVFAVSDSRNPQDWYAKAQADLEVARLAYERTNDYDVICFLSHQAVEKTLKGALFGQGMIPDKSHDTARLLDRYLHFKPELKSFDIPLRRLDDLYTPSRYPKPGLEISQEDAEKSLETADQLINQIQTH